MKRVIVVLGGKIEEEWAASELEKLRPFTLIAADRGLSFCRKIGIRPDYIVGDFDSSSKEEAEYISRQDGIPMDTYKPEKDMTDADIGLEKAADIGADQVFFIGATGGRLDHELSNLYDLVKLKKRGIEGWILDAQNRIRMPVSNQVRIRKAEQYGKFVSCIGVGGPVTGVTLKGFYYPLDNYTMKPGDGGLTVSNQIVEEEAVITYDRGDMLVIESRDR
ncbi:MAG: thiamine diphosphokinase [Eubacterium sp.]|nr:thiamine diphosphokinase [Eubacterium sp.]